MSTANQDHEQRGSETFWFYALLGSIFSAFALISLTEKIFDIGLVPVMQEVLDYYRKLVHPPMHWLLERVQWLLPDVQLPAWAKDAYALSFVGGFAGARAFPNVFYKPLGPLERTLIMFLNGVWAGATGLGLLLLAAPLFALIMRILGMLLEELGEKQPVASPIIVMEDFYRLTTTFLCLAVLGSAAFFAINSQL